MKEELILWVEEVQRQFFQNVMHTGLHRVGGNVEPLGNFLVAQAFRNQVNDCTKQASNDLPCVVWT
jgi:hypothetical protein